MKRKKLITQEEIANLCEQGKMRIEHVKLGPKSVRKCDAQACLFHAPGRGLTDVLVWVDLTTTDAEKITAIAANLIQLAKRLRSTPMANVISK